jgi:hypothetical protein
MAVAFDQDAIADGAFEVVGQCVVVEDLGQHRRLDRVAEQRRDGERGATVGAEAVEPARRHLAHALRHTLRVPTGAALVRPAYLAMLAAVDVIAGERKSALSRLEEALEEVDRTGERLHEAQLLVAKSHLLSAAADRGKPSRAAVHAAETCLRQALDVARAQGARLLELRAAVALGRHCRERGRPAEARALVASAHAWFENRRPAAPEIISARQLLAELR